MRLVRLSLKIAFVAIAWAAVALVAAIPYWRASDLPLHSLAGGVAHAAFSPFCHQDPGRCFHLAGCAMPLCARCFGLVCGVCLGTLLVALWPVGDLPRLRRLFALALAFLLADCALNAFRLYDLAWLRWITGIALGSASSLLVMQGIAGMGRRTSCPDRQGVSPCTC